MNRAVFATLGLVVLFGIALAAGPQLSGQETKPAAKAPAKAKAKGRLPAYYKDVVSDEQRTKIYEINEKYGEEIAKLAEQMKAAVAKRDAEVEAVLSPEQAKKVADLRAAAATKKKEADDDKAETTEATKPAAKPMTTAKP